MYTFHSLSYPIERATFENTSLFDLGNIDPQHVVTMSLRDIVDFTDSLGLHLFQEVVREKTSIAMTILKTVRAGTPGAEHFLDGEINEYVDSAQMDDFVIQLWTWLTQPEAPRPAWGTYPQLHIDDYPEMGELYDILWDVTAWIVRRAVKV